MLGKPPASHDRRESRHVGLPELGVLLQFPDSSSASFRVYPGRLKASVARRGGSGSSVVYAAQTERDASRCKTLQLQSKSS